MDNVSCMQILHRQQDLSDYDCRFDVAQSPALVLDKGEQIASRNQFLEKVTARLSRSFRCQSLDLHGIPGLHHFLNANNVWLYMD